MKSPAWGYLLVCALLLRPGAVCAEAGAAGQKAQAEQGKALLQQARYPEAEAVFSQWIAEDPRNPEAHFYLALSRALQGKLDPALSGFQAALRLSPQMADAVFEIGGIYLRKKEYRTALSWVEKGLRLEPGSEYGLDLAGTLHFLLDSKIEALRYWNRLDRPHLTELHIESATPLDRQSVAAEIDLKPGSLISFREVEKARWRLRQHDYIRTATFLPVPGPQPDQYALDVLVDARRKFGSPLEFAANTFAGAGFGTYRLTYWNLGDKGVTINLPLRFKSGARLAGLDIRIPRPAHLGVYATASYAWRDESWALAAAQGTEAPASRLRTHEFTASALVPVRIPRFSIKIEVSARRRLLEVPVQTGSTGSGVAAAEQPVARPSWQGVLWMRVNPRLVLWDRRSLTGWGWGSQLQAGVEAGRISHPRPDTLSRLSISWENRLDRSSRAGRQTAVRWGIHAGRLSSPAPLEDHFLLGVGPDTRFQLRAHPIFRDGMLGKTPLAERFVLGNLTVAQDLHTWKWLRLGAAFFADAAYFPALYPAQQLPSSAVDTGAGMEFGIPGISAARFMLAYGRDWKGKRNAFYFSTAFR